MERKGFAEMKFSPGRVLAEIASPMLGPEQQRRLSQAWMLIYLSGKWTEAEWRKALGFSEAEWGDQRPAFAEVLASEDDWALPFMRDELLRQNEFSAAQSARRRTHFTSTESTDGHRRSPSVTNAVGVGVGVAEKSKPNQHPVSPKARRDGVVHLTEPNQPPPNGVEPDTWSAWFQFRGEIKKPLTELSARMCAKELEDFYERGHDPDQIIRKSIANRWQGLFIPKEELNGTQNIRR